MGNIRWCYKNFLAVALAVKDYQYPAVGTKSLYDGRIGPYYEPSSSSSSSSSFSFSSSSSCFSSSSSSSARYRQFPILAGNEDTYGYWDAADPGTFVEVADAYWVYAGENAHDVMHTGLRFQNITVPQGATIDSAYVWVKVWAISDPPAPVVDIYGEDVDNAGVWNSDFWARHNTKTDATVSWETWDIGWRQSPDIATIIQEIVNREGWISGNGLALFLDRDTGYVRIVSYENEDMPYSSAYLEVEFSV